MDAREFLEKLPDRVQPESLEGIETTFHFDISGDGGAQKTISIENGEVAVADGLNGEPNCVVSAEAGDLMAVLNGDLNPMMAMMTGKIKISNSAEMLKYARVFGLV